MAVERVVVSTEEIGQIQAEADAPSSKSGLSQSSAPPNPFKKLPSPVPWWARVGLSVLVLALPLLCLLTIVLRIAFRTQPPRVKYAWVSFLSTLLVISGFLTVAGGVLFVSFVPVPAMVNTGLPELDERASFPDLPSATDFTSSDVSAKLKPLVIVVSPATHLWNRQEVASSVFGAGVLLQANKDGYLFATANHVAAYGGAGGKPNHALVATAAGIWATADVVALSPELDLALLWMPRRSNAGAASHGGDQGTSLRADFTQPIVSPQDGENVFVIGHPEGLKYTLSTGIVSGLRDDAIQISAAVSPGNSGGPVYDSRGNLLGIVSSKFDHNRDANAENLSFAAKADAILKPPVWNFQKNGARLLQNYVQAETQLSKQNSNGVVTPGAKKSLN